MIDPEDLVKITLRHERRFGCEKLFCRFVKWSSPHIGSIVRARFHCSKLRHRGVFRLQDWMRLTGPKTALTLPGDRIELLERPAEIVGENSS